MEMRLNEIKWVKARKTHVILLVLSEMSILSEAPPSQCWSARESAPGLAKEARASALSVPAAASCLPVQWSAVTECRVFFTKSCRVNHNLSIDWKGDPMWNSFEWLASNLRIGRIGELEKEGSVLPEGDFLLYMMQFLYRLCRLMPPIDNTRFCPNTNGTALRSELYKKRLGCVRWGTRNASRV